MKQSDRLQLQTFLQEIALRHERLCPRRVLGLRIGMMAGQALEVDLPQKDKRLFTVIETDGCAAHGVSIATGCWVGRRTMRVVDFGKVAATFVDTATGRNVRISPHPAARQTAFHYAPEAPDLWHAQLAGYQVMPAEALLVVRPVRLIDSLETLISQPGLRAVCDRCMEEIINAREVISGRLTLCRSCAGAAYYHKVD